MTVILPFSLAYLAQAMARRMFGVSAPKPITSLRSMEARISWSLTVRSSISSTGRPAFSMLAPR
jgi:hypothetical protein